MRRCRALTLVEVVVTVGVLLLVALIAVLLMRRLAAAREEARRILCRSTLNQIAKAVATYLYEHGDNRFYPCPLSQGTRPGGYNGAEWIAALYWSSVMPDPGVYLCPSSTDSNANGLDIGLARAAPTFGSQTISYAGMHYRSGSLGSQRPPSGHRTFVWSGRGWGTGPATYYVATDRSGRPAAGPIRDDFPPFFPMASDDTQGAVHHGWPAPAGLSVLFFDGHVEFLGADALGDLRTAVGRKDRLLWQLRN